MASSSFNEFSKIITKHVLDDPAKLDELKKRFEVLEHAKSKAGAAAIAYLMAQAEHKEKTLDVYDKTLEIIRNNRENEWICADSIFTMIYQWLDEFFEKEGFADGDLWCTRYKIKEMFESFVILP
jgi:hypothetical protein